MPVPPRRACPGCCTDDANAFGTKFGFDLLSCGACATVYTAWLPAPEDSKDYGHYYHEQNLAERPAVRQRLDEVVKSFARYRAANRWLDVGCGAGTLMRAAAAADWRVEGTEVAPGAIDAVRGLGFEVHLGDLGQLELPAGGYDVVSLVEVVEHLADPDSTLVRAAGLLRPGGALYVTTPHGRGLSARALGARWSVVHPPEHLQLYSVKGMHAALKRAGFKPRRTWTHGANPSELRTRFQRESFSPAERGQTSRELNEALVASARGRFVKRFANGALNVTRLGDALKLVAERQRG